MCDVLEMHVLMLSGECVIMACLKILTKQISPSFVEGDDAERYLSAVLKET